MNIRAAIAALAFLASAGPLPAMADAAPAPVTFNVAVKVSNLTSDVADVAVKCSIETVSGGSLVTGEGQSPVSGGAFDGTVTVPVAGSYTVQQAIQSAGWECDLYLVDATGKESKVTMVGGDAWAKPGPGPLPVIAIKGSLLPATEINLDPYTGNKPSPAVFTPVTVSTGP